MTSNSTIDKDSTSYILKYVASQFCDMVREELEVVKEYQEISLGEPLIVWKRAVTQVREICDVCSTTLFNLQWTCSLCGTSVCIDCYKERKANFVRLKPSTKYEKEERDKFYWFKCHNDQDHQLILTQMIPGDSFQFLQENVHKLCDDNGIKLQCVCRNDSALMKNYEKFKQQNKNIVMLQNIAKKRRLLLKPLLTSTSMGLMAQAQLYNKVPHCFISNGQILKFTDPIETDDSYKIFQHQFQRGKPVVVANVINKMRKFIWSPEYFLMRFGKKKHSLVNCQNDAKIHKVRMHYFWEGFQSIEKRLPESCEKKMILKLKDWPTSNDFADVMKDHFIDLMKAVPFADYTTRGGKYNLAKYLHGHFCSPDLGPKMYSAYGQDQPAKAGSTNLHLDVSDAINVLAYVSRPKDYHLAPSQYSDESVKTTMEQCGCDKEDIQTFLNGERLPGAIWYIYPASNADAIRKILREEARERGKQVRTNDDPLHDQNCFIDYKLREKLSKSGITGYTIVQWEGDAVFVPAGAPHQVLNIFDCVKVALDFVSPENISECFNLTSEFRRLSSRHTNKEDKLQIKNILYHVIKSLVPSKSEYDL
jgi:lysine-specific demethylase 3